MVSDRDKERPSCRWEVVRTQILRAKTKLCRNDVTVVPNAFTSEFYSSSSNSILGSNDLQVAFLLSFDSIPKGRSSVYPGSCLDIPPTMFLHDSSDFCPFLSFLQDLKPFPLPSAASAEHHRPATPAVRLPAEAPWHSGRGGGRSSRCARGASRCRRCTGSSRCCRCRSPPRSPVESGGGNR